MEDEGSSAVERTASHIEEGNQTPLISSTSPQTKTFKPWLHAKPLSHVCLFHY